MMDVARVYRDFLAAKGMAGEFTAQDFATQQDRSLRWAEKVLRVLVELGDLNYREPDRHGARGRRARVYWRVR